MKELCEKKVPFVKMSQDDPLYPPSKKNDQVDIDNNNLGEFNMKAEGYSQSTNFISANAMLLCL